MAHPIIEAQDGLKEILQARSEFAGTDIRDALPTEQEDMSRDMFWLGDVEVQDDDWASIGAQSRRVTFDLEFTVEVLVDGDAERDARSVVLSHVTDFMLAIKANPNLGRPTVIQQVETVTGALSSFPAAPQQWGARFIGRLAVISRAY